MILTGLVFFLIGSIIAAVARDFAVLLAGRSLQGIGGGGLIALTEIVVADLVPLRLRGQWFGLISAMWALGSVTGPIIGGAFAQAANWVSMSVGMMRAQLSSADLVGSAGSFGSTYLSSASPLSLSHCS